LDNHIHKIVNCGMKISPVKWNSFRSDFRWLGNPIDEQLRFVSGEIDSGSLQIRRGLKMSRNERREMEIDQTKAM